MRYCNATCDTAFADNKEVQIPNNCNHNAEYGGNHGDKKEKKTKEAH